MPYPLSNHQDLDAALQSTHAGRQLAAWLHYFNMGNVDAFAAFIRDNQQATHGQIDDSIALAALTGGLTLYRLEQLNDSEVVAIAKERHSVDTGWRELVCRTAADTSQSVSQNEHFVYSRAERLPRRA